MKSFNTFCSWLLLVSVSLVLLACGGGGGGGGGSSSGGNGGGGNSNAATSVTLSTSKLGFNLPPNAFYREDMTVNFKGDGLIIGYPPGVPEAGWLSVATQGEASPVKVQITANSVGLAAGSYSTTLRFVTGLSDGSKLVYKDVAISLKVDQGLSLGSPGLTFEGLEGGELPTSKTFSIQSELASTNWKLVPVYGDGGSNWLTLSETSGSFTGASHSITATPKAMPRGNYSARVELRDDKDWVWGSMLVYYNVAAGISVSGTTEKTIEENAATGELNWNLTLQTQPGIDTTKTWQMSSDSDWLSVSPTQGTLSSLKNLTVTLSPTKLMEMMNGTHTANITLTSSDPTITPVSTPIKLNLSLNPQLIFEGTTTFSVGQSTTAAGLTKSLKISTNLGSAFAAQVDWEATETSDWLTLGQAGGNSGSANTLDLQVDANSLAAMASNHYSTLVKIKTKHPRFQDALLPVSLSFYVANVDHVSPYVVFRNQSSPVIVRGSGFVVASNLTNTLKLSVGNTVVDATVVSDTELKVNLPAMNTNGRFKAQIVNQLNLDRSTAEIVVKTVPQYTRARVELDKVFRSMTLDAERNAVLLGNGSNEIRRLTYGGAGWTEDKYETPFAQKSALSIDGKELLVAASSTSINDTIHHLNANTLTINKTQTITNDGYSTFDLILPFNDGQIMLIDSDQWPEGVFYPSQTYFYSPSGHYTNAVMSRDHSRVLLGGTNDSRDIYSYDINRGEFVQRNLALQFFRNQYISMSSDASRLVAGDSVYDKNFSLLGSLTPLVNYDYVAITPDGKTVYGISNAFSSSEQLFKQHDLSAAQGPYPATAQNPDFALEKDDYPAAMMVTDDGTALLVLAFTLPANSYDPTGGALYVFPLQ